ncbi:antibiotic biosynthesis monooxygenase [Altererythrobacter salegens]|uniref:Antibiotic biosynthesis monooxygenase n=1 Tax=Croceibacterium salegens TaxID=1737568 RepID=A0A6I4SQX1_9SPHN|nr:antibiotic biosynthesis monooxygenase [Croceibacterium salegens]
MIVVSGHFRLPTDRIAEAREPMLEVITASLLEPGCRTYSYAEDVTEAGLFRVYEEWDDRAALEAHFATRHMRRWQEEREALGFHDRDISIRETGDSDPF